MKWIFELVAGPFGCTAEGPAWDGRFLYFTLMPSVKGTNLRANKVEGRIMRYDPKTDECLEWRTKTDWTNSLAFDARGRLYGCCARGRSLVRFESDGKTTVIADRLEGKRLNTPNDLVADMKGRIWFTNPWNGHLADPDEPMELGDTPVLRADPSSDGKWTLTRVISDMTDPAGILVSADQRMLFVSERDYRREKLRELRAYPIQENGSLGSHTVLHQFGQDYRGVHRGIRGMSLDAEGNIVACAGWPESGPGSMVYVFSPSGRVLETHPIPTVANPGRPANCTFGDRDLQSLYVVTSGTGHVFRARTDRQGWSLYP